MWITVRTFDGSQKNVIRDLSKLTKIEVLREKIAEVFDAPVSRQMLYYGGKQLVDGHTLFDYNIGLDQIIQLMIRPSLEEKSCSKNDLKCVSTSVKSSPGKNGQVSEDAYDKENNIVNSLFENAGQLTESKYFKVGETVYAKDTKDGTWFKAIILGIKPATTENKIMQNIENQADPNLSTNVSSSFTDVEDDDNLLYTVAFEGFDDLKDHVVLPLRYIRQTKMKVIKYDDVSVGDTVMINYNIDEPDEEGDWYDCIVTGKKSSRNLRRLIGTILLGANNAKMKNCKINVTDQKIFPVTKPVPICERIETSSDNENDELGVLPKCKHCKLPSKDCKECGCNVCGKKNEPNKQVLCDECNYAYHIWCLDPPLSEIPEEDDWYCSVCKTDADEVVKPGEKLKESKKRKQMPSFKNNCSRDWGKGMACAGRTKVCTIVPSNHFGPIPGVEVGTMWKFRIQVSESGVHRPVVAGISGCTKYGSYSIVLSGGYEDDKDDGEVFTYTGSGGRSLEGNKRTAGQSCDQVLTKLNLALAMDCAAEVNLNGAEAKDWKKGKPVRVIRNYKGRAHSSYAPEEGNRYDGIYKVVKYWPEKGKSGFIVWRYLLRRDDDSPAPWTKAGKKRSEELGLVMQYPPGYLESQLEKETKQKKGKRVAAKKEDDDSGRKSKPKKIKLNYTLPKELKDQINKDSKNKKLWQECLAKVTEGKIKFLDEVKTQFECICCQDLVSNPITTVCCHNVCQPCLTRSFTAKVFSCPMCRSKLDKHCIQNVNKHLHHVLLQLFPGYNVGR